MSLRGPPGRSLRYTAMDVRSNAMPKTQKGRERRARILEVASREFAVLGARNVSLASIAQQVGITEQGAMHYFPTKEHLLLGVLEESDERDRVLYSRMVDEAPSALDALLAIVRHQVEHEAELATLNVVLMAESIDPAHSAHTRFLERNRRARQGLEALLAWAQGAGQLRPEVHPGLVAAQLRAMVLGLVLQWALDPGEVDVVAVVEPFLEALRPQ